MHLFTSARLFSAIMFSDQPLHPARMLPLRQPTAHHQHMNTHFPGRPLSSLAIPPGEDAQPNDQSDWLPPRPRCPLQPLVIRLATALLQ
ncbi:hypothetical protein PCANC_02320 [Puccinia coronata f. sp. avenae]|uniref:Uncharacterized protein n=1 Tax=Puccinia coronata f. sp. avenae TaxID=200324 RepID=A0A2N5VZG1_9BASI|nr:hypothetical protein PCANC_02320 [Puccinia coronata f. sp. avenae]